MAPVSRKFQFTKKKIEALPPNDRNSKSTDQEYSDATTPGLKLFVSKNGRKSFHYRYIFNGRKRVIKIGDFDCIPLDEVREIARMYRGLVNRNIDPLCERCKTKDIPTLREFSESYMQWARSHKRSWRDDENKLNADILPAVNGNGKVYQLWRSKSVPPV